MNEVPAIAEQIRDRLRAHWPAATCVAIAANDDPSAVVRVHVADDLWLELRTPETPEAPWTAGPVMVSDGTATEVIGWRAYGIGARQSWPTDDVADRFYEELRFWAIEYEAIASAPPQTSAG